MKKLSIFSLGFGFMVTSCANVPSARELVTQTPNPEVQQEQVSPSKQEQNSTRNGIQVNVFFPVEGEARDSFNEVQSAKRWTNRVDVAHFAIEELIAGPTASEQRQGLKDLIEPTGESVCRGKDFTIRLEARTATLQFCRTVVTGGVGDDARITTAINQTLKQFPSVDEVIILNKQGDCFKDMSSMNLCLQQD